MNKFDSDLFVCLFLSQIRYKRRVRYKWVHCTSEVFFIKITHFFLRLIKKKVGLRVGVGWAWGANYNYFPLIEQAFNRTQELPVPNKPYGLCGREVTGKKKACVIDWMEQRMSSSATAARTSRRPDTGQNEGSIVTP